VPLGRDSLYDALQRRSVYATSGPVVPVAVAWSAAGESLGGLGADLALPAGTDLDVRVAVPPEWAPAVAEVNAVGPSARIALADAGDGTWTATVPAADVPAYLYVAVALDGGVVYADAPCADGGAGAVEWVWTSPSWITPG
jgi:hypothetical protein